MSNPFEIIDQRLSNIESLLLDIKHPTKNNEAKPESDLLLTRIEASKFLKISLPKLDEFTKNGELPGSRIGTRVRYLKTDLINSLIKIKGSKSNPL